jgi:hypothetical protein
LPPSWRSERRRRRRPFTFVGLFMLIATAVVVFGIVGMLDEPDDEQTD